MEIKKSRIGARTKVPHLSYIGDAEIGEDTNVAAGNVTANLSHEPGRPKGKTTIGKNVRTGVDNTFVAPVTVGDDAWLWSGTIVTDDVPPGSLAGFPPRQDHQGRVGLRAWRARQNMATTSELARLPGLEAVTEHVKPEPGHWLERGPQKRLMVFSGRSHPELSNEDRRATSGVELGDIELRPRSRTTRRYCRYLESIRGADVFLVQTGCDPVDRNLMELLLMIQARQARLGQAHHRGDPAGSRTRARTGRRSRASRSPRRLVADMLQLAGADRVLTMDLHAGQIQGFFTIPVDHMTALPLFARHFRDLGLTGAEIVSVAPDAGRAKVAVRFAEMIEADFAIMNKTRPAHDVAAVTEITGRVSGKRSLSSATT